MNYINLLFDIGIRWLSVCPKGTSANSQLRPGFVRTAVPTLQRCAQKLMAKWHPAETAAAIAGITVKMLSCHAPAPMDIYEHEHHSSYCLL